MAKQKLSKAQYRVLMQRTLDRQGNAAQGPMGGAPVAVPQPPVPPMGAPSPALPAMPGGMAMGMPTDIGQQPAMDPNAGTAPDLMTHIQDAQELFSGIKGGLGEQVWRLIHGNSGSKVDHESAFIQEAAKHGMDPKSVTDPSVANFIQQLKGARAPKDDAVSQLDQAMMGAEV